MTSILSSIVDANFSQTPIPRTADCHLNDLQLQSYELRIESFTASIQHLKCGSYREQISERGFFLG